METVFYPGAHFLLKYSVPLDSDTTPLDFLFPSRFGSSPQPLLFLLLSFPVSNLSEPGAAGGLPALGHLVYPYLQQCRIY